jgi:hypothetical protein
MDHADATSGGPVEQRSYSEDFRHFVVGLTAPGQPGETLSLIDLVYATGIPRATLKEWLQVPGAVGRKKEPGPRGIS